MIIVKRKDCRNRLCDGCGREGDYPVEQYVTVEMVRREIRLCPACAKMLQTVLRVANEVTDGLT